MSGRRGWVIDMQSNTIAAILTGICVRRSESIKSQRVARQSNLCSALLCLSATLLVLPRIAFSAADIQGTWKITAPQEAFKPEGGATPFTARGRMTYESNKRHQAKRDYDSYDYATARCASPGLPRLMITPERFRVWQRPGVVTFLFEWNRLFRQIDMGGLLPRPMVDGAGGPGDSAFIGKAVPTSKGHWDSDTLVVTTEGFDDSTLIDQLLPHGERLRLVERLRLRDSETLEDVMTIEDPEYYSRPWLTTVLYKRQPNVVFPENVCLERLFAKRSLSSSGQSPALTTQPQRQSHEH